MKNNLRFLFAFSLMTALSITSAYAFDFDYSIKKYYVNLNFNKNNSINTTETIDASFNNDRNGISRKLNLNYSNNDKTLTRVIKNVETNDIHVLNKDKDTEIIKISDIQKRTTGQKEYNFVYDSLFDGKLYSKDFKYDIVDGTWNRTVENVNFKLTFPKKIRYKKIEFLSSRSGVVDESLVEYSIKKNVLEGRYTDLLFPNEKLTIHMTSDKKHLANLKNNQILLNNVKNQNISVYEGDEIIIILKSNPTTGFVWQLSADSDLPGIVELSEGKFIQANKNICGASGITEYRVKALNKGKATINGVYVRPWMKNEDTSKNAIEYSIEVKSLTD